MTQTSQEPIYRVHPDLPPEFRDKALEEAQEALRLAVRHVGAIYAVLSAGDLHALQKLAQDTYLHASRVSSVVIDIAGIDSTEERALVHARVGVLVARARAGEAIDEVLASLIVA